MIAEATAANIFLVKDGIVKTPPCTCTLDGITRKTVMRLAQDLGVPVEQTPVSPDALFNADEVFLTGTAHGIVSVDAVDGHCISRRDTPEITAALRDKYIAIISGRDVPYPEWITCF
jgi:branched-chain amino acid aminotransferase